MAQLAASPIGKNSHNDFRLLKAQPRQNSRLLLK